MRVRELRYALKWLETAHPITVSEGASPLQGVLGDFKVRIEGTSLTAEPTSSFSSEESARAVLEPILADWEVEWDLRHSLRFKFVFESCTLDSERDMKSPRIEVHLAGTIGVSGTLAISRNEFPALPSELRDSQLVRELRSRWHDVQDGNERLLVGSQWILTRLEGEYGGRNEVAKVLLIAKKALDELGRLNARNDPEIGRKAKAPLEPLTPEERGWVLHATYALVVRAAEVSSGVLGLAVLTEDSLPKYSGTRRP